MTNTTFPEHFENSLRVRESSQPWNQMIAYRLEGHQMCVCRMIDINTRKRITHTRWSDHGLRIQWRFCDWKIDLFDRLYTYNDKISSRKEVFIQSTYKWGVSIDCRALTSWTDWLSIFPRRESLDLPDRKCPKLKQEMWWRKYCKLWRRMHRRSSKGKSITREKEWEKQKLTWAENPQ